MNPTKTKDELMCSGIVCCSCSTSGTSRIYAVPAQPVALVACLLLHILLEGTKGEGWGCENDKWSTSMVTCEIDIP